MSKINVIQESHLPAFENSVNAYLEQGWSIISTSSGHVDSANSYYDWFQAVVQAPEPKEQPAIEDISSNTKAGYFALGCVVGAFALALGIYLLSNY